MEWKLEPGSWRVVRVDGGSDNLTVAEYHRQVWPPCPACGTQILVDMIPTPTPLAGGPETCILGNWRCPRGCDPNTAR